MVAPILQTNILLLLQEVEIDKGGGGVEGGDGGEGGGEGGRGQILGPGKDS